MAIKQQPDGPTPAIARRELLAAKRISQRQWQTNSSSGPVTLLPFTSIGDQPYTTYMKVI